MAEGFSRKKSKRMTSGFAKRIIAMLYEAIETTEHLESVVTKLE